MVESGHACLPCPMIVSSSPVSASGVTGDEPWPNTAPSSCLLRSTAASSTITAPSSPPVSGCGVERVGFDAAQVEREPPLVARVVGMAPELQRARFREGRGKPYRERHLAGTLAITERGHERSVTLHFPAVGEIDDGSDGVGAIDRAVESECRRLVAENAELAFQLEPCTFFGALRYHAHRASGSILGSHADVVGTCAARTNEEPARGRGILPQLAVERCPERHRGLGILVLEDPRPGPEPHRERVEYLPARQRRREEAAVEQDGVRTGHRAVHAGACQERREMPGDGRFGLVRQTELAQADAPVARRQIVRTRQRKEPLSQRRHDFSPGQLRRHAAADHAATTAEHGDGETLRRVAGQERFLRGRALPAQHLALCEREPRRRELLFDEGRQREIEIVAAKEQVLADGDPFEGQLFVLDAGANEAEVGGAAADVDDEDEGVPGEALRQLPAVRRDPRVERGERLFEQRQPLEASRLRGFDRQLAGFFVERRRHGQHDLLLFEPRGIVTRARVWFQASRMCASSRAEASTGDSLASASAPHGSSAAVRSTWGFESQDFADEISRPGISAPSSRAKTPAMRSGDRSHGSATAPESLCPCSVK